MKDTGTIRKMCRKALDTLGQIGRLHGRLRARLDTAPGCLDDHLRRQVEAKGAKKIDLLGRQSLKTHGLVVVEVDAIITTHALALRQRTPRQWSSKGPDVERYLRILRFPARFHRRIGGQTAVV